MDICYHFSYNRRPICTILGEMTDAGKIMHPQHFGTDPTDLRIQFNPKIQIRILYHFWLKVWRWRLPAPPSVNAAAYNSRDYVTVHCSTPMFSLHHRHTCILFRCSVTVCLYASLCFIASLLCCLFYSINSNLFVDK